jgi:hypothetical protein
MFKKILFVLLISNVIIPIFPPNIYDAKPADDNLPIYQMEDPYSFDDEEEEFYFDQDNLVQCWGCSNWAQFIFYDEGDIYGLCAKCYLGG